MIFEYKVRNNIKLYDFLKEYKYSEKVIKDLVKNKKIYINDIIYKFQCNLVKNDIVRVILDNEESNVKMVFKDIDIVYEDEYILIVNKPYGLASMISKAHSDDSLSSRVKAYFYKNNDNLGIHMVNRLDMDSMGLMIFAKHAYIHHLFSYVKIDKYYLTLVKGRINKKGIIRSKIAKVDNKRVISELGKDSISKYWLVKYEGDNSLVRVKIETGRTHQIRVHFNSIGHPLVNDSLYNDKIEGKMFLFAYKIRFKHPLTNKIIKLEL